MHAIKGSEMYLSAMVSVKAEFADSRSILFECDFYSNLFSISTLYWFKESNMGTSVVARQILVVGSTMRSTKSKWFNQILRFKYWAIIAEVQSGEICAGQHSVFSQIAGRNLLILGWPARHRPPPPTVATTLIGTRA